MDSKHNDIQHIIHEGQYRFITIDPKGKYVKYTAMPLITCFAYLILYQTIQGNNVAVLYHAKSGLANQLKEILQHIQTNCKQMQEIVIAIPNSMNYQNTPDLLNNGKRLIQESLNNEHLNISIVENAMLYSVDTVGNHGTLLANKKVLSSDEEIYDYLISLKNEMMNTKFTVINFLREEVEGTPRGVKDLMIHLEKLDAVTRNNVNEVFKNVCKEFENIKNRKSDRTTVTLQFYNDQMKKNDEIKSKHASTLHFKT